MPKLTNITDEFTEPTGMFDEYTPVTASQEAQLRKQKHVNIRSFVPDQPSSAVRMLQMDHLNMFYLNGKHLSTFSGARIVVINNEGWTYGEVGPQADRNNWNGIVVECDPAISSETTTQSVITQNG